MVNPERVSDERRASARACRATAKDVSRVIADLRTWSIIPDEVITSACIVVGYLAMQAEIIETTHGRR